LIWFSFFHGGEYHPSVTELFPYFAERDSREDILALFPIEMAFNLGLFCLDISWYQEAIDLFNKSFAQNNDPANLANIGNVYIHLSDFNKAVDYMSRAIEITNRGFRKSKSAVALYHFDRAAAFINLKNFGPARADFNDAIRLDPSLEEEIEDIWQRYGPGDNWLK